MYTDQNISNNHFKNLKVGHGPKPRNSGEM